MIRNALSPRAKRTLKGVAFFTRFALSCFKRRMFWAAAATLVFLPILAIRFGGKEQIAYRGSVPTFQYTLS